MAGLRAAVMAAAALWMGAAPAFGEEFAVNREGAWAVGRGAPDSPFCYAMVQAENGATFMLRADAHGVTHAVATTRPMRRGRDARMSTEAYAFHFTHVYNEAADRLFAYDYMNERAIAALRLARTLKISVDGRTLVDLDLEGTGHEAALDAVMACGAGGRGWWGEGVAAEARLEKPALAEPPLNKEGFWALAAGWAPATCIAGATVDETTYVVLIDDSHGVRFGVKSAERIRRGRKGRVEIDGHAFDFRPVYDGESYVGSEAPLDPQALSMLRAAREVRITVDGRPITGINLEGSGHGQVITDLAACARGEAGWWGEGAEPRPEGDAQSE